jgi:ketosteroid isomerase-like protein
MTHDDVQDWLDRYVDAWRRNERQPILDLFTDDATYAYGPYRDPIRGRDAIADSWLDGPDPPDSWAAQYRPIAVEGDTAVVHGRSRYFQADRTRLRTEYDNIFVIRFAPDGRAREFAEWFMERPAPTGD